MLVIDEGIEDEEVPNCLKERICFYIDLNTIPLEKIKIHLRNFHLCKFRLNY